MSATNAIADNDTNMLKGNNTLEYADLNLDKEQLDDLDLDIFAEELGISSNISTTLKSGVSSAGVKMKAAVTVQKTDEKRFNTPPLTCLKKPNIKSPATNRNPNTKTKPTDENVRPSTAYNRSSVKEYMIKKKTEDIKKRLEEKKKKEEKELRKQEMLRELDERIKKTYKLKYGILPKKKKRLVNETNDSKKKKSKSEDRVTKKKEKSRLKTSIKKRESTIVVEDESSRTDTRKKKSSTNHSGDERKKPTRTSPTGLKMNLESHIVVPEVSLTDVELLRMPVIEQLETNVIQSRNEKLAELHATVLSLEERCQIVFNRNNEFIKFSNLANKENEILMKNTMQEVKDRSDVDFPSDNIKMQQFVPKSRQQNIQILDEAKHELREVLKQKKKERRAKRHKIPPLIENVIHSISPSVEEEVIVEPQHNVESDITLKDAKITSKNKEASSEEREVVGMNSSFQGSFKRPIGVSNLKSSTSEELVHVPKLTFSLNERHKKTREDLDSVISIDEDYVNYKPISPRVIHPKSPSNLSTCSISSHSSPASTSPRASLFIKRNIDSPRDKENPIEVALEKLARHHRENVRRDISTSPMNDFELRSMSHLRHTSSSAQTTPRLASHERVIRQDSGTQCSPRSIPSTVTERKVSEDEIMKQEKTVDNSSEDNHHIDIKRIQSSQTALQPDHASVGLQTSIKFKQETQSTQTSSIELREDLSNNHIDDDNISDLSSCSSTTTIEERAKRIEILRKELQRLMKKKQKVELKMRQKCEEEEIRKQIEKARTDISTMKQKFDLHDDDDVRAEDGNIADDFNAPLSPKTTPVPSKIHDIPQGSHEETRVRLNSSVDDLLKVTASQNTDVQNPFEGMRKSSSHGPSLDELRAVSRINIDTSIDSLERSTLLKPEVLEQKHEHAEKQHVEREPVDQKRTKKIFGQRLKKEHLQKIEFETEKQVKERERIEREAILCIEQEKKEYIEKKEAQRRQNELKLELEWQQEEQRIAEEQESELQKQLEIQRIEDERIEQENIELQRLENQRLEHERLQHAHEEQLEREHIEREVIKREHLENEHIEKKRLELIEKERQEKQRIEGEIEDAKRLQELQHAEKICLEHEQQEKLQQETQSLEQASIEMERQEIEYLEIQQREQEPVKNEQEYAEEKNRYDDEQSRKEEQDFLVSDVTDISFEQSPEQSLTDIEYNFESNIESPSYLEHDDIIETKDDHMIDFTDSLKEDSMIRDLQDSFDAVIKDDFIPDQVVEQVLQKPVGNIKFVLITSEDNGIQITDNLTEELLDESIAKTQEIITMKKSRHIERLRVAEQQRLEQEMLEQNLIEQKKIEKEYQEEENQKEARLKVIEKEHEQQEKERLQKEQEKLEKEKIEFERIERERQEKEHIEHEQEVQARIEKELVEQELAEKQCIEAEFEIHDIDTDEFDMQKFKKEVVCRDHEELIESIENSLIEDTCDELGELLLLRSLRNKQHDKNIRLSEQFNQTYDEEQTEENNIMNEELDVDFDYEPQLKLDDLPALSKGRTNVIVGETFSIRMDTNYVKEFCTKILNVAGIANVKDQQVKLLVEDDFHKLRKQVWRQVQNRDQRIFDRLLFDSINIHISEFNHTVNTKSLKRKLHGYIFGRSDRRTNAASHRMKTTLVKSLSSQMPKSPTLEGYICTKVSQEHEFSQTADFIDFALMEMMNGEEISSAAALLEDDEIDGDWKSMDYEKEKIKLMVSDQIFDSLLLDTVLWLDNMERTKHHR